MRPERVDRYVRDGSASNHPHAHQTPVALEHVETVTSHAAWRPPVARSSLTIVVAHSGLAFIESDGASAFRTALDPTQAVLVRPGTAYRVRATASARAVSVLSIAPDAIAAVGPDASPALLAAARTRPLLPIPLTLAVLLRLRWLRHGVGAERPGVPSASAAWSTEAVSLACDLVGSLLSRQTARGRPRPRASLAHRRLTEDAKARLAASPGDAHPLAEVARALGASPYHLARVFHAEANVSLHRYLLELRLAGALEQLATQPVHLSTLALDLGFATHSHFTYAFRRAFGRSPRLVQRALTAEHPPFSVSASSPAAAASTVLHGAPGERGFHSMAHAG